MAADIDIISFRGVAGATQESVKQKEVRFKLADNNTPDVSNPLQPGPDPYTERYSWRKHIKLKVLSNITVGGNLSDLVWYAEEEPVDWNQSLRLYMLVTTSYTQASSIDESTLVGALDANNYSIDTPLSIVSGIFITQNASFGNQPYLVLQMGVTMQATTGIKYARGSSYAWKEV